MYEARMGRLDFSYDESTDYISKEGHYSMCQPHEATREEALLWRRVQELEELLDENCPEDVANLLDKIEAQTDAQEVALNAQDFARVRQYARHRVEMLNIPAWNRKGVLASFPRMIDGSPSPVLIAVKREVPVGEVYGAST